MKRYIIVLLLTIFIIPISVNAAATYDVLTVTGSQANNKVSYSGTTEDGVYAVSCSLLNSKGDEVDFKSSSVSDKKFSDTFDASEDDYTIKCANYDGGKYVTAEVKKSESAKTEEKNPTTGDNVINYVIILSGCITLLGISLVVRKRLS